MTERGISHNPDQHPLPDARTTRTEQAVTRWVEGHILAPHSDAEPLDVTDSFITLPSREKAELLFEKLMAYSTTQRIIKAEQQEYPDREPEPVDPYLVAEIQTLWADRRTQQMFVSKFAEARVDAKLQRASEFGRSWQEINEEIETTQQLYTDENRKLFLQQVSRPDQIAATKGRTHRFANELIRLHKQRDAIMLLEGRAHIKENTDTAADIMYETLGKYHDQVEQEGFAWLPSREAIHAETVAALQNGRWPVLTGEAGTGKSEQADAAARALTGHEPTHLACGPNTGFRELIADKDIDPATGGSYETYGPAMQAATGYEDSRQTKPVYETGRVVRLDESGRLGMKGYSEIKELRQKRSATPYDLQDFYEGKPIDQSKLEHGKPVLPGFTAILTTNPEGARYPDRIEPDAAMRREIAPITVDYPPMTQEDPELYEFMLATLMDENNHIPAPAVELSPLYVRHPVDRYLPDGQHVIAEKVLLEDPTDPRHGTLYRLSFAVRALQDAFNYGNYDGSVPLPTSALRYRTENDGSIKVVETGGDPLTLSSSTITLGEIASWMKGFQNRRQKDDPSYQVDSLTEWIQMKVKGYIHQSDAIDRDKIQAIFAHFHLFDTAPDISDAKPIIPREIGYLSSRVPQPLDVEDVAVTKPISETVIKPEYALYEDLQCVLEDESTVFARLEPFQFTGLDGKEIRLKQGSHFLLDDQAYRYIGIGPDGKIVAQIDTGRKDEALHRLLDVDVIQKQGEFNLLTEEAEELFGEDFLGPEAVEKTFGIHLSLDQIPDIAESIPGITLDQLERAKELGHMLVLRTDRAPDGSPLTMQKMEGLLQSAFDRDGKGKIFYDTGWYKAQKFFTKGIPKPRWALVSKEAVPHSKDKNYLQQTEAIADYLKEDVFKGMTIPDEYQTALHEFDAQKASLATLILHDWQEAAKRLSELKLNQLIRRTPVETLYDTLVYFQNNDDRLLQGMYDWTISRGADGRLVLAGNFVSDGLGMNASRPDYSDSWIGVCLSR